MNCPRCGVVIKNGEHVRGQYLAMYRSESTSTHGISAYKEEWVEHLHCPKKRLSRIQCNDPDDGQVEF